MVVPPRGALVALAQQSVRSGRAVAGRATSLQVLCDQLEHTRANLARLEGEIEHLIANDPDVKGLQQVQEFGLKTVAVLRAELGDVARFSRTDQAVAYAGLGVFRAFGAAHWLAKGSTSYPSSRAETCGIVLEVLNEKERLLDVRKVKHKVFAYITHQHHLLVFRHPDAPEAGIQVPAGTVEEHERAEDAVLREAFEETGWPDLTLNCFLGEQERDMSDCGRDEVHHRRFYHLCCHGHPPTTWRHEERSPSDTSAHQPILFEFFWAALPHTVPSLIADHGIMLPRLLDILSLEEM